MLQEQAKIQVQGEGNREQRGDNVAVQVYKKQLIIIGTLKLKQTQHVIILKTSRRLHKIISNKTIGLLKIKSQNSLVIFGRPLNQRFHLCVK